LIVKSNEFCGCFDEFRISILCTCFNYYVAL